MSSGHVFQPVRFVDGPTVRSGNGAVFGYLAGPGRLLSSDPVQVPGTQLYLFDGYTPHGTGDGDEITRVTGQC